MNKFPASQHRITLEKRHPNLSKAYGKGAILRVTAHLSYLHPNPRPHFSVTGAVSTEASRYRNDLEAAGCLHNEILHFFPRLAPIVRLHLCDDNSEPMHAAANGLYWMGFGRYSDLNPRAAADHFRISKDEVKELRERIMSGSGYDADEYDKIIDGMRLRWQFEAAEAIALLQSLRG